MKNLFTKTNEPIIIENKNFQRCILYISFPIKEDNPAKIAVLKSMAFNKSMTYDTDKKIYEVNINNYCLSYHGRVTNIGKNNFLELELFFPSAGSIGKDVLEDNLKFIRDIIYHPYLENGTFPVKEINDIIAIIKNRVSRDFKDSLWYYEYENDKVLDENDYLKNVVYDNPNILDNITAKDITKLYKDIISSSPLVFLIGNISPLQAQNKIKKILLGSKEELVKFEKKYHNYCKNIPLVPTETVDKTKFKTSFISYNYKVKDLSSTQDIALLQIVQRLLDSNSSRLLLDELRTQNDLVYRCGAYIYSDFGSLTIYALTGKQNIDKVKEIFDKIISKICDISFIEEKLNLIIESAKLDSLLIEEDPYDILMREIDKYIECKDKNFYELIKDVSPEEIKKFIEDRLRITSKYMGVGEENE